MTISIYTIFKSTNSSYYKNKKKHLIFSFFINTDNNNNNFSLWVVGVKSILVGVKKSNASFEVCNYIAICRTLL